MKPKELIELDNPSHHREWHDYLAYRLEYYPAKAWDMYQSKKLERYLTDKATQIVNYEQDLLKRLAPDQAHEIAYEAFMPSDTDLPDQELLSFVIEDQQREILDWAQDVRSRPTNETTS